MSRAISLAAVLVVAVVLAGQAQNDVRPAGPARKIKPPAPALAPAPPVRAAAAAIVEVEEQAGQPDRTPKTEVLPPNAVGLPHDAPPQHALASAADGQLKLVRFTFQNQQQYVVAKVEIDGRTTSESILRTVPVGSVHTTWHALNSIRGYVDGEELDAVELANRLAKSTHVLISTKKVDPFYLESIKDGMLQLIVPESLLLQNQPGQPMMQQGFFNNMFAPAAAPAPMMAQ